MSEVRTPAVRPPQRLLVRGGGLPVSRLLRGAAVMSQQTVEDRFWEYVDAGGDCWLWTGHTNNGYGRLWSPKRQKRIYAHRWVYEKLIGPIPSKLHIDHLCRVRNCVNPDHLEAVSLAENNRRSPAGGINGRRSASKTHCPQGHQYEGRNLYVDPRGKRQCRTCTNRRSIKYQRKRRQEQRVDAV